LQKFKKNHDQLLNLLQRFTHPPSIITLSETWIKDLDYKPYFNLPGYTFISRSRKGCKRGGGVGIYISNDLSFVIRDDLENKLNDVCEYCVIEIIKSQSSNEIVVCLYKPPDIDIALFDSVFSKFLKNLTIVNNNKKIIIAADWNVDLSKASTKSKVDRFLNNMLSFGLLPTVTCPTRITERTASLIDNIFVNCTDNTYFTRVIYDDISDHLPILINISNNMTKPQIIKEANINKYVMSALNYSKFKSCLAAEKWSALDPGQLCLLSPHEAYNTFLRTFSECFDRSFLMQTTEMYNLKKKINLYCPG
jgi:hypothetical protein